MAEPTNSSGNWATEETMQAILKVLKKQHGGKIKGSKRDSPDTVFKANSEAFKKLNKVIDDNRQSRRKAQKQFDKDYPRLSESMKATSDATRMAGNALGGMGKKTTQVINELEAFDGSVKGTSDSLFKVIGRASALSAVVGVAAGVVDQFIDFQTGAIQRGFMFSQSLIDTRDRVADVGFKMAQMGEVIANNGEALRFLGRNGKESTDVFIGMMQEYKSATGRFGYYGQTSAEMAGQMIETVDLLRRSGMDENMVRDKAVESMAALNQETYALAKITGRDKREIMRNSLEAQEDSAVLIHNLGQLGPKALANFQAMSQTINAAMGPDSVMGELVQGTLETYFAGGQEKLSREELAFLDFVPGLRENIEKVRDQMVASGGTMDTLDFSGMIYGSIYDAVELIKNNADPIAKQSQTLGLDDQWGKMLSDVLKDSQQSATFLETTQSEYISELNATMDDQTAMMLRARDNLSILQTKMQSSFLKLFQIDSLEDLADPEVYARVEGMIDTFGNSLGQISSGLSNLAGLFGDGDGSIIDELAMGAAAFFGAKSLFTTAMTTGAATMFSSVAGALLAGGLLGKVIGDKINEMRFGDFDTSSPEGIAKGLENMNFFTRRNMIKNLQSQGIDISRKWNGEYTINGKTYSTYGTDGTQGPEPDMMERMMAGEDQAMAVPIPRNTQRFKYATAAGQVVGPAEPTPVMDPKSMLSMSVPASTTAASNDINSYLGQTGSPNPIPEIRETNRLIRQLLDASTGN